ncbi:hypothetical protein ACIA58_10885 [Kribbella sp. NPDC051586]|uniref:hypothetical protein n=1 Tax=Kribbella sp. NPDC051586 TaxID=3364118 RepID=UPI0037A9C72B
MSTRAVAMAHGIVGFTTCVCLIVFFAAGGPFGTINDFGNALFGVVSFALAWLLRPAASWLSGVLVSLAGLGAALTIVGTVLVVSNITGYYLAGLWSSSGFGLIGIWLVGISRPAAARMRRAGLIAGAVMVLGLVGVPGIFRGLDILEIAPAWTYLADLSWAGTYLLFPAWSLGLAWQHRPERVG